MIESNVKPDVHVLEAQGDVGQLKTALRNDAEFFIDFFMHDELVWDIPVLHTDVFKHIKNLDVIRLVLAIPRGHAKTTLSKLGVIWYFLFSNYSFCVYLSNTAPIAKNACRDIMEMLQSDNFRSVFGDIKVTKHDETQGLWIFHIGTKRCILRGMGANQQVRGINIGHQRPDIVVVDDLEDKENIKNATLLKQLIEWFFSTFIKALAKHHKIMYLGNMVAIHCLLGILTKSPHWTSIVYGCLIRGATGLLEPLWPDLWPMEALMEDYREYQRLGLLHLWMAEMMNMPVTGTNGFGSDQFYYQQRPFPDDCLATFITIDPAFSKNRRSDCTAIVVHAILSNSATMVVDHTSKKMSEGEIFDEMLTLALRWNAWTIGIESVAAQKVLITLFKVLCADKKITNLQIVPIHIGNASKLARISAWVGTMEQKAYALPVGDMEITSQLLTYDKTKEQNDDDLIDCCSAGLIMLEHYLGLIMSTYQQAQEHTIQGEAEVCNV